jgi:hypothetical protein
MLMLYRSKFPLSSRITFALKVSKQGGLPVQFPK